uniref:Homeobox domain-containing protein n=1 Tax=Musa acuminata subsp. malaccensis TaxID=214687 RepID=A0A804K0Y9_MUSAM|nr:PREDICTED: homeobox-leucine zipper protein HAT22-like isoform X2 [Musa acuminata subsp. malaccensis]
MDISQEGDRDINLALELCIGKRSDKSRDHGEEACSNSRKLSLPLGLFHGVEAEEGDEEEEAERLSSRGSDEEDEGGVRKKLRLTKEQSALLEDRFKEHSTINPKQKQTLAGQLNLRPRQIEVWFQNRRARTKLKKMEVDSTILKRYCEKLSDENQRLQKELQQLKALTAAPPLYMHFPAAASLTMCPTCGRRTERAGDGPRGHDCYAGPLLVAPKPYFLNPSFIQQHVS